MKDPKPKPDLYEDITGVMMWKAYKSITSFANYHKDQVTPSVFASLSLKIKNTFLRYCIDNILKYDLYTDRLENIVNIELRTDGMSFSTEPLQYGYKEYFDDKAHDLYKNVGSGFTDTARDTLVMLIESENKGMIQTGYYLLYKGFIGSILMRWVMDMTVNILSQIYPFNSYLTLSYTMNHWFDEIANRPFSFINTDTLALISPVEAKEMNKDRYNILCIKPRIYVYPHGYVHMDKAGIKILGRNNE